ncbi:Pog1 protein [Maudiozyma humilis]|uniref:Pog1 protein n=1 Tax=Maudiozyma humilis TaxID=51915 RepID=A0AAV5RYP0_MAUHU|nr:Pog1 protein [Kazachstania humilis]
MNSTDAPPANPSGNVKSLLNSDPASAPPSAASASGTALASASADTAAAADTTKIPNPATNTHTHTDSLRTQLMRELDIAPESDSSGSPTELQQLVEARLLQRRQEVETLRQVNLASLTALVDKCIASDKFDAQSVRLLLDTVVDSRSQRLSSSNSGVSPVLLSPMGKKRRAHSPQYSRLSNGDLHTLHERGSSVGDAEHFQSVAQQYKLPPPPSASAQGQGQGQGQANNPWLYNSAGTAGQPYLYGGNLAPPPHIMNDMYGGGYPPQGAPQLAPQGYMAPGYAQGGAQGYYPQGTGAGPVAQSQSPYRNGAGSRARGAHRRTQSAIVSMPPSDMRSPGRGPGGMPQRPVNFLIHTPKHPPPT